MNLLTKISHKLAPVALKVTNHSPAILFSVGAVSITAGTIWACRTTYTSAELIMDEHHSKISKIKECKQLAIEDVVSYTPEQERNDKVLAHFQTAIEFVHFYWKPVGLFVFGMGCMFASHRILHKRNLALVGAYKLLDEAFKEYRERVRNEVGEEKERDIYFDKKLVETIDPETGEVKKLEETISKSPYARIFDSRSRQWSKDPQMNITYLMAQQRYFNNLLQSRGHVFLNEVYDALGVDRTKGGQLVGWLRNRAPGEGDGFIDFGIGHYGEEIKLDPMCGWGYVISLDFNVDGVILDAMPI